MLSQQQGHTIKYEITFKAQDLSMPLLELSHLATIKNSLTTLMGNEGLPMISKPSLHRATVYGSGSQLANY